MIFILLSILFNAYIGIIFKYFGNWKINIFPAIVMNYWICVLVGSISLRAIPFSKSNFESPWFLYSVGIGILFISLFYLMSVASVKIGITLTQAANKMSLAIPVFFSIYLYNEPFGVFKILGILSALLGVFFITQSEKQGSPKTKTYWWLLPVLFIGSGMIDTITKYVETSFINSNTLLNTYIIHCFAAAATFGTIVLLFQKKSIQRINVKTVGAGLLLGIPNYFSIYFVIKSLQFKSLDSSAIIPINNIGILVVVTLYGFVIFQEKLSIKNKIGIGLAAVSILLLLIST